LAESELIAARREKLARLRARGVDPYPYRFDASDDIASIVDRHSDLPSGARTGHTVRLAGRLVRMRRMGKAAFADIQDSGGTIQLFLSEKVIGSEAFDLFLNALDLGDIVGVVGEVMTTRAGELSVEVAQFTVLAKALRPLPDKWHGLQDIEKRYRRRALDLIASEASRAVLAKRTRIVRAIRTFLDERGFLEVETPILQLQAGGATARPFVTHHNVMDRDLYLRIAPELYLKRLLVGGFERVYELGRTFRNEGVSTEHNPEFTMLEAYQAYGDYNDAIELAEGLVTDCAVAVGHGATVSYQGRTIDLARPWKRVRLLEAVADASGADVERPADELLAELLRRGVEVPPHLRGAPKGKLLEHLLETLVQPSLWDPTFVMDYPVDISPLAKRVRDGGELVERFELFIAGKEVANAFSELNDPEEQRERFRVQDRQRAAGDEEVQGTDEDFVADLELGMPPAAGIGVGVDRLTMVLTDSSSIRQVIAFPLVGERR